MDLLRYTCKLENKQSHANSFSCCGAFRCGRARWLIVRNTSVLITRTDSQISSKALLVTAFQPILCRHNQSLHQCSSSPRTLLVIFSDFCSHPVLSRLRTNSVCLCTEREKEHFFSEMKCIFINDKYTIGAKVNTEWMPQQRLTSVTQTTVTILLNTSFIS